MHGATKRKTIPVKIQPTNPPQISIILLKNSCFVVTIFTPLVESTVYPARVSMDWLRELIIFFASFRCTVIPISIQLSTRRWEITASCISVDISMNTSSTQFCFIQFNTLSTLATTETPSISLPHISLSKIPTPANFKYS